MTAMPHERFIFKGFEHWNALLLILALTLCLYPSPSVSAGNLRVLLLLSSNDKPYELAADSLRSNLLRSAGPAVPFDIKEIELPFENGMTLPELLRDRFDLIVTIGTGAAWAVGSAAEKSPVLNIMTTKDAFDVIWGQKWYGSGKVSAIYLEQPLGRQLRFIRAALPHYKNCGVLLGNRSAHLFKGLELAESRTKLDLKIADISASNKPIDAIKSLIENSDVILVLPDSGALTPNIAKWLLYMAYQRGIPVIGFSKALVDAGALGAIHATPEQIGRQAAEIILRAAIDSLNKTDRTWRLPAPQYPRYFDIAMNDSVARALKLNIQPEYRLAQSLLNLEQSESWRAGN